MPQYNYAGYPLKILDGGSGQGDYVIPDKFISHDTLHIEVSTTDLDSYRDANNVLHRQAINTLVPKVEFNTPYIDSEFFQTVMSEIRARYMPNYTTEKRVQMSVWSEEYNQYFTQDFYLIPDIHFTIYKKDIRRVQVGGVYQTRTYFLYDPIRIAFIGYGVYTQQESDA